MKKTNTIIKFGEDAAGYAVPVLNEREIRASAGIMFLALLIALTQVLFKNDFFLTFSFASLSVHGSRQY